MGKVGGLDDPLWTSPSDEGVREGRSRRRSKLVVVTLAVIFGLAVVYPAVAAVLSRKDFGTFAFWKLPNRIDYCGRRYYQGGAELGSPSLFESQDTADRAHWSLLSWTFSGRSIYADVAPLRPPSTTVCSMVLYIPLGGGSWETYVLSGGP